LCIFSNGKTDEDTQKSSFRVKKHLLLDFVLLVEGFGFHLSRVSGSHHIFVHPEIKELVNLQNVKGQVKPYQAKQLMELVERYSLELEE
jgi:predicted RNA binding protein YcfA (HicA-like mRNA interferase family)